MFISHSHKLLFLEVPRTGSRSISQALTELDPESPTVAARRTSRGAADYHGFKNELLADPAYRVVATHRNPYERLWSFWKHRRNTGNPPIFHTISWSSYVDWVCDPTTVPELVNAQRDIPIAEMFDLDRVDFWLDFSHLGQNWAQLAQTLGLPLPPLKIINSSPDHGYLSNAYSPSIARRVSERFSKDFDYFGYSRDSWKIDSNGSSGLVSMPAPASPQLGAGSTRPRVAILTTFSQGRSAFSLQRVVQDQLAMFVKHGYEPTLLVVASDYWSQPDEYFADERVTVVQYPKVKWVNETEEDREFLADIEILRNALQGALAEADVVITHDIIYLPQYLKLCIACRQVARELPALKWLHWIHSATGPSQLKKTGMATILFADVLAQKWPGSYPVFFNRMSIPRIARNFNYDLSDVKIVPHPTNICHFLGLGPLTTRLYEEKRLYLADYVSIVPVRLDRGKQVDWVIKIMACLKALGESVRIVVMDFHSQDTDKSEYRNDLKSIACKWGLNSEELTFLSEFDDSLKSESPHSMVRELFSLSNVFIQASASESYSLVTQEAAICGNLLVLNDDFPPFREIFGEQALYFQFSSNIDRIRLLDGSTRLEIEPLEFPHHPPDLPENLVTYRDGAWCVPGDAAHANLIAKRIRYEFSSNMALLQRQKRLRDRNLFTVFSRHVEPLILTVCQT